MWGRRLVTSPKAELMFAWYHKQIRAGQSAQCGSCRPFNDHATTNCQISPWNCALFMKMPSGEWTWCFAAWPVCAYAPVVSGTTRPPQVSMMCRVFFDIQSYAAICGRFELVALKGNLMQPLGRAPGLGGPVHRTVFFFFLNKVCYYYLIICCTFTKLRSNILITVLTAIQ